MKKRNKLFLLALSLVLILSLAIGCSGGGFDKSSNGMTSDSLAGSGSDGGGASPMAPPMEWDMVAEESALEPEKVITTINLEFETTEFDQTTNDLMKLVEKYKAYVENSNISYNQYYNNKSYKYAQFVIRVPKDDVMSFKTELNGIGNMISENTNKEDVTKQYRDTESRLRVVTTKEERLLALLEKAEKIEDIIALENQLSEVIYEKESLQSSLITIDDKVDFSTVRVNLQEVERLRNAETVETTFGTKIKNAIEGSLYGFKNSMQNLFISLIYILPFLTILAIALFVIYLVIKKFGKFRNKDKLDK
ncbi:MAG TPA: DUF4349 domain-containing protein [Tissierellaceae bacterium]|nr:DUF4349 domain-containing protein [Tissierellaceae bacterium]